MSDRSATKFISITLIVLCALALVVGVLNAVTSPKTSTPTKPEASDEKSVADLIKSAAIKKDHLIYLDLEGPIVMSPDDSSIFSSDSNAVSVRKALDKAAEDNSVKGVLLRINSPGGTVGMSQELNAAVQRVRAKKPIVASLGDVAASGGYYTACATDKIIANPGTLTASIGVIISTINFKHLMEDKLGVTGRTFKSGRFKDLLSPYKTPDPAEDKLIQQLVDESYQDFFSAVLDGRVQALGLEDKPKAKAELAARIKAVADGRVVNAKQGIKAGIVDEVGDLLHAQEVLEALAVKRFNLNPEKELPLKTYDEKFGLLNVLGLSSSVKNLVPKAEFGPNMDDYIPMSMRYPNQPLWIME